MAYYPTVTMVLWAFLTVYLKPTTNFLQDAPGFFIGAVLLWDVLFRGQLGVSLTFIEEMYSRNLGNLFVSPLRLSEFIAGQLTMSVLRTLIGVGGACFFAWLLFRYSIFSLGFPLIAFFWLLLAFGWSIGLAVSAMILRWGLGAEELAWAAIFLVAPVSGVYYPIAVFARLAAISRVGTPVGPRVRRNALRAAGGCVPVESLLGSRRTRPRLSRHRRSRRFTARSITPASTASCCTWANSAATAEIRVVTQSPALRRRDGLRQPEC